MQTQITKAYCYKCKKLQLYTLLTATDLKPQKSYKKAMLTTLTLTFRLCVSVVNIAFL